MDQINDIINQIKQVSPKLKDIQLSSKSKTELEEWYRCKQDFFYFLNNHVKLNLPGANISFKEHKGQEFLMNAFLYYHYIVTLKTRQIGITTVVRALVAWCTIFFDNIGVGIISKKGPDATAFVRNTIHTIEHDLDSFLIPQFNKKSEQQFFLKNGSYAIAEAVSPVQPENTLRSNPITVLIIDEAAFVHKIDEAISGLMPTIVTAHKYARLNNVPFGVIVMSTPNKTSGTGKWFFDMYKTAVNNTTVADEDDDTLYKAIKLHWKDIPLYRDDPNWYESQKKMLNFNRNQIAQELDCTFIPSDRESIIDADIAIELSEKNYKPINIIKTKGGEIWQFKELSKDKRYIVGIDTATASGTNAFSAIEVFDFENNEQVLEYMGKLSTLEFPSIVMQILDMIGLNCFIVPERNTIGEPIVDTIIKNVIYKQRLFKTIKKNKNTGFIESVTYGLNTSGSTKPLLVEAVTTFIEENYNKIYSERLILQILDAKLKNNKLKGLPNDLLMATSFCTYAKKYTNVKFINFDDNNWMDDLLKKDKQLSKDELMNYLYNDKLPYNKELEKNTNKLRGKNPDLLDYLFDL